MLIKWFLKLKGQFTLKKMYIYTHSCDCKRLSFKRKKLSGFEQVKGENMTELSFFKVQNKQIAQHENKSSNNHTNCAFLTT